MTSGFSGTAADWLRIQRDNFEQQRWIESIALGRVAWTCIDLSAEEAAGCSRMLCDASLKLGEMRIAADTFAVHLRRVTTFDDMHRLLLDFCARCTIEQARPVIASLTCDAFAYYCISVNLFNQNCFECAEALVQHWRAQHSGQFETEAARMLGWIYWRMLRYADSVAAFERSLSMEIREDTLVGLGYALNFMGRYDESVARFRQVDAINPVRGHSCRAFANSLFGMGEVAESMDRYELRMSDPQIVANKPADLPEWNGESLPGRLLVLLDPGYSWGDYLMYLRYLVSLRGHVQTIRLRVHPAMERVVRASFPDIEIRTDDTSDHTDCEAFVWIMSLAVKLKLYSTASETLPWLKTSDACMNHWGAWWHQQQDGDSPRRRRIGICWRGNPHTYHDRYRSASFDDFTPLFETLHHVDWINMQLGAGERPPEEALALRDSRWLDPMQGVADFEDTAAIAAELDLLVTIDSAVAHLCLSRGTKAVLLVPVYGEWRWQTGDESLWYPNALLARTAPGSTFRHTLQRLIEEKRFD